MKGCRPFSDGEVKLIAKSFSGRYAARNKALFILGVRVFASVRCFLSRWVTSSNMAKWWTT
jgi:hypothetical protein